MISSQLGADFWIQLSALVVTIVLAVIAATWAISRSMTASWHAVDLRLEKIDTVVSPYGDDIAELKNQQSRNVATIAELKANLTSVDTSIVRHDNELAALRNRVK